MEAGQNERIALGKASYESSLHRRFRYTDFPYFRWRRVEAIQEQAALPITVQHPATGPSRQCGFHEASAYQQRNGRGWIKQIFLCPLGQIQGA